MLCLRSFSRAFFRSNASDESGRTGLKIRDTKRSHQVIESRSSAATLSLPCRHSYWHVPRKKCGLVVGGERSVLQKAAARAIANKADVLRRTGRSAVVLFRGRSRFGPFGRTPTASGMRRGKTLERLDRFVEPVPFSDEFGDDFREVHRTRASVYPRRSELGDQSMRVSLYL